MYIHICIQNAATMNEILENAWQDIYGIQTLERIWKVNF